ncbi:MAG: ATP-grasp domain-containing protein [Limnohabitans sp.]|nr:ATP-grasp domain-containing protein [Limnohabitans sp.]
MLFLIQSNVIYDPDRERLCDVLNELGLPYKAIDYVPGVTNIEVETTSNNVFVYGSVLMAKEAAQYKKWYPGSFYGGNHLYANHSSFYVDNMINTNVTISTINDEIDWKEGKELFIKPYQVAKLFTGRVFNQSEWEDFKYELKNNPYKNISGNELIQISMPRKIFKEARLWVIGGQIVEASYYKFSEETLFEKTVPPEGIDFAKRMIKLFEPAEAFVMDIGYTELGWKIVEINCVNSSGFYPNTNIRSIVNALNIYFKK